jgi:uncharacterized protein (DUF2147 family)
MLWKVVTLSCLAFVAVRAEAAGSRPIDGIWTNPKESVAVRTQPCGGKLCGFIVWVNGEAARDARESGVASPVGTEVLRDYVPASRGSWLGTVYVPDMGRSFRSRLTEVDPNDIQITGCLVGNFICRSQTWHRRPS